MRHDPVKTILFVVLLLIMIPQVLALTHINETVGDFRISFDDKDDTNMITRGWDVFKGGTLLLNDSTLSIKSYMVLSGDFITIGGSNYSQVVVIIWNKPVKITDVENNFINNKARSYLNSYLRVYDRTIDNHEGIYVVSGDTPEDLDDMDRFGLYWLDEAANGTATEMVLVHSLRETEIVAETLIDTVHVEKITGH